ncbi:MAG TPA: OmpA family protein, partial [Polyangiaceae bacterium]|nr:OmpA family protein [Polyangiaceae bacterium]
AGGAGGAGGGDAAAGSGGSGGGNGGFAGAESEYELRGGACTCQLPGTLPQSKNVLGFSVVLAGLAAAVRRRRARKGARRLASLALALTLTSSRSEAQGFVVDRYSAPVSPQDLFWTERADPGGGKLRPFGRLTVGYADDPLVAVPRGDEDQQVRVVDSTTGFYASAGLVFAERFQAALLVPIYAQNGLPLLDDGATLDPDGAAVGNPGADLRFVALDRAKPIELALAATLRAPLGAADKLVADDGVSVWPRIVLSKSLGQNGFAGVSVGSVFRESAPVGDIEPGSELTFAAGALVPVTPELGVTAELAGSTVYAEAFSGQHTPLEATGGLRYSAGPLLAGVGAGAGLSDGYGSPDLRLLATVGVMPEAQTKTAPSAVPETLDRDGDGIRDDVDRCPDNPEDRDGFEDDDGCPELDNDRDGVPDSADSCANVPEDKDQYQDEDGCPEADNDGDGIPDAQDRCPMQAEDRDGWQDADGCPEADNDSDGIADAQDKCPNEAETKNGKDDEDGCPDLVRVEAGQIRTLEPIYFEYNKAQLQARSEPLLVEMANVIRARADLGRISIEGHTDDRGPDAYNLKLSDARAQAVMKFLVDAGVSAERLAAKGFGETRPIEPNATDAGRAKNRRVEFLFVDKSARAEQAP